VPAGQPLGQIIDIDLGSQAHASPASPKLGSDGIRTAQTDMSMIA